MKIRFRKLLALTMVVSTLFAFASNSAAYTRNVTYYNNYAMEIDAKTIGSGNFKAKVGITSISTASPYYEILYTSVGTILDRSSSYVGYSTKPYRLDSTTT